MKEQCGGSQDEGKSNGWRCIARAAARGCQNAWELHRGIMDKSKGADTSATASFLKGQLRAALIEQRLALPDRLERLVHELKIRHGSRVAEQPAPAFRQHQHLG